MIRFNYNRIKIFTYIIYTKNQEPQMHRIDILK